jgi:hypothetical protein
MMGEWFFAFMNDLSRFGVGDNFMVKVVIPVNDATVFHILACLVMEVVA